MTNIYPHKERDQLCAIEAQIERLQKMRLNALKKYQDKAAEWYQKQVEQRGE